MSPKKIDDDEKPSFAKATEGKEDHEEDSNEKDKEEKKHVEERDDDLDKEEDDGKVESEPAEKDEKSDLEAEEKQEPSFAKASEGRESALEKQEPGEHNFDDLTSNEFSKDRSDQLGADDMDNGSESGGHIPHLSNIGPKNPSTMNPYASYPRSNGGGNKFHILILVVIGLAVIGATVYLLKGTFGGTATDSQKPQLTPAPVIATPTPEPTPIPIDRAKFTLRVLNGTSTSGLAKDSADKLKLLGYQIEKTGNATNSAFTKTQIRIKSGLDDLVNQLISDLAADFSGASTSPDSNLKASDSADAEVILGAD